MTTEEAKRILSLYRPGTADRDDPGFAEALEMAQARTASQGEKANPELAGWFADHCANYLRVRRAFLEIPVPPGLKGQIIGERKVRTNPMFSRRTLLVGGLAALVAIAVVVGHIATSTSTASFTAYRARMVRTALMPYGMEKRSSDLKAIDEYLQAKNYPSHCVLPRKLKSTHVVGCATLTWQGNPVSMLCFSTGRPLAPGQEADLWLFIIDEKSAGTVLKERPLLVAKVNKLITGAWSEGDKTYLLATEGDAAQLQGYLN